MLHRRITSAAVGLTADRCARACLGLWLLATGCAESTDPPRKQPVHIAATTPPQGTPSTATAALSATVAPSATAALTAAAVEPRATNHGPLPSAVAKASASVVRVTSYVTTDAASQTSKDPHPGYRVNGRGLGVVIKHGGFVLTSYELLRRQNSEALVALIDVQPLDDPKAARHQATIVGLEPTLGLAVVQAPLPPVAQPAAAEPRELVTPGSAIYAITNRDSDLLHAAGNLAGLPSKECYQESISATMLRAELVLPPDTLGCPVFSASGRLVGLNTGYSSLPHESSTSTDTDRHLLPIDLAFNIHEALETKRSMRSPWTGFSVRRLAPEEQARFPVGRFAGGIALEYIWKNSPAEKLGLKVGDILVRLGHYPIRNVAAFQKWLYMHGVGDRVKLYFLRNQEIIEREYLIEERPGWAVPR